MVLQSFSPFSLFILFSEHAMLLHQQPPPPHLVCISYKMSYHSPRRLSRSYEACSRKKKYIAPCQLKLQIIWTGWFKIVHFCPDQFARLGTPWYFYLHSWCLQRNQKYGVSSYALSWMTMISHRRIVKAHRK